MLMSPILQLSVTVKADVIARGLESLIASQIACHVYCNLSTFSKVNISAILSLTWDMRGSSSNLNHYRISGYSIMLLMKHEIAFVSKGSLCIRKSYNFKQTSSILRP